MRTETTKVNLKTEEERQQIRLERAQRVADEVNAKAPVKRSLPKGLGLWIYAPMVP